MSEHIRLSAVGCGHDPWRLAAVPARGQGPRAGDCGWRSAVDTIVYVWWLSAVGWRRVGGGGERSTVNGERSSVSDRNPAEHGVIR